MRKIYKKKRISNDTNDWKYRYFEVFFKYQILNAINLTDLHKLILIDLRKWLFNHNMRAKNI